MTTTDHLNKKLDKNEKIEKKIEEFQRLLDSIDDLDDKRRMLWKEIYKNASEDRDRAGILYTNAVLSMDSGTATHISLGPTLSKYLERMSKSNEQILRLAEMIVKVEEKEKSVDIDVLYESME